MGTGMTETRKRWDPGRRADAYSELEHPSDLFLEIHGRDLPELFENALFAFYDQIAQTDGLAARRELILRVREPGLDEALRSLLSEALYRVDTEGFVAVGGKVAVEGGPKAPADDGRDEAGPAGTAPGEGADLEGAQASGDWRLLARLWGDKADREHHTLLREVKAVTYHRLEVRESNSRWQATVLLDI
jgi:protein archease